MQDLINKIQNIIGDYWESFQERDDAEYALHRIENLLDEYRHKEEP
jgi:hypothetical protein